MSNQSQPSGLDWLMRLLAIAVFISNVGLFIGSANGGSLVISAVAATVSLLGLVAFILLARTR